VSLIRPQDLPASAGISSALGSMLRQFSGLDTPANDMLVGLGFRGFGPEIDSPSHSDLRDDVC
jgi:hypothetical protein